VATAGGVVDAPRAGRPLDVLAFAPLPYREDGRAAFERGVTIFYAALLPRLAALGHRVRVVAEAPPAAAGGRDTQALAAGVAVSWFAFDYHSSARPAAGAAAARLREQLAGALERALAGGRPDVVLVGREIVAPALAVPLRAARLATVVVAHGPATLALRTRSYPAALRAELTAALAAADAVVTVGRHLETALRALGVPRVVTVANVADPAVFRPAAKDPALLAAYGLSAHHLVIAHASGLRPLKRPLDLVESAHAVCAAVPAAVYLIIGNGPSRAETEARVRALGLGDHFRFAGQVEHARMPAHLALADLVVLPSDAEGFPLVYGEAQACGRALLASDIPPAREAIRDGATGLLFRTGDVADLAAKTATLAGDPALRARLGAAARAVAVERTPERWAAAYAAILADAAAGRRPPPA